MPTLFSTMGQANVRLIEVPLSGGLLPFPADHWRSGIRPIEASEEAVCYVRLTSTPAGRLFATNASSGSILLKKSLAAMTRC